MNPLKFLLSTIKLNRALISRLLVVLLVLALVGVTIWLSGPIPQRDSHGNIITPQASPVTVQSPADAKLAKDLIETTPTTGVALAGLSVVVIVLLGSWITIRSQK